MKQVEQQTRRPPPPPAPPGQVEGAARLLAIMRRLRAPDGCPWDREQTLGTLKPCVLEETYELLSAMDDPADRAHYIEELGDVLLQVVFQCAMAEERGDFTFNDVANAVSDKLVRRHPHVFGDVAAGDSSTVLRNWELIKERERAKETRKSALDGVPSALPALLKAQRISEKASRVGFDWKDSGGAIAKIREELDELESAVSSGETPERVKEELGDVLFSVANYARFLKSDAESALQGAADKFSRRFRAVEAAFRAAGKSMRDSTIEEMDRVWDEVKRAGPAHN